jgi:hypothetical protein
LLQRDGQVKILDFGIARMARGSGDLTRTGLIMGSLRYMAPEQIRGRADARSDMFSVGAVFYEFLSFRPPFAGDDPIQLLEQLRADEPPALQELDPTIPPDVVAIVARALRKDPADRFADLQEMRVYIEQAQRRRAEEAQRIRSRLPGQCDALRELQAALAERLGREGAGQTVPALPDGLRLMELQALERDLAGRIDAARGAVAQADGLEPAIRRGMELLEAGEHTDAVLEFEAVIADMPEHARAARALGRAREEIEMQRRRQLCARLVEKAHAALQEGGYAFSLDILGQAAEIAAAPEAAEEIRRLREAAQQGLAAQESARRARQHAEVARQQVTHARQAARIQHPAEYAPNLWNAAETRSAAADAAFTREAYVEAAEAFAAALALFRQAEAEAREARGREERQVQSRGRRAPPAAGDAADVPVPIAAAVPGGGAHDATRAVGAVRHEAGPPDGGGRVTPLASPSSGLGNEPVAGTGQRPGAGVRDEPNGRGISWTRGLVIVTAGFVAIAAAIYYWSPRATPPAPPPASQATPAPTAVPPPTTPAGALPPARDAAGTAQRRATAAREEAIRAGAERLAPAHFAAAIERSREAEAALDRQDMEAAQRAFREASERYELARAEALRPSLPPRPEAAAPPREPGEAAKPGVAERQGVTDVERRGTEARETLRADASVGDRSVGRTPAGSAGVTATKRTGEDAGQPMTAAVRSRQDVEQARTKLASARRSAEQVGAGFFAPKRFASAQAKEQDGNAALSRSDHDAALRLLGEAQSEYQAAAEEARRESEAERQIAPLRARMEQARAVTLARREQALAAAADRLAQGVLADAEAKHDEADDLAKRKNFGAAAQAYQEAADRYAQAIRRPQGTGESR